MKKKLELTYLLKSGYIRMPRALYLVRYSDDPEAKLLADLYEFLYSQCFFKKGNVRKRRKNFSCERGQFICSHAEMAEILGIRVKRIPVLLEELKRLNLIEVEYIRGISHIGILYYDSLAGNPQEPKPEYPDEIKRKKEAAKTSDSETTRVSYKNHPLLEGIL